MKCLEINVDFNDISIKYLLLNVTLKNFYLIVAVIYRLPKTNYNDCLRFTDDIVKKCGYVKNPTLYAKLPIHMDNPNLSPHLLE